MTSEVKISVERRYKPSGNELLWLVVLYPPMSIWSGFVFSTLWNWFIPTQFTGAPTLNVFGGIGITLVIGWALSGLMAATSKPRPVIEAIFMSLAIGGFLLFAGWIVQFFV